jgi:HD-like signal output (HDOD) protein
MQERIDGARRALNLELPVPSASLAHLTWLLGQPACTGTELVELVVSDMSMASAVLKTVNSSMFGVSGRVKSVREAITYLGTRELAAMALQHGLREVFPPMPELSSMWDRAALRGRMMGHLGEILRMDGWAAHSAGLFEECGKALLLRHAPERYRPVLANAGADDRALVFMELEAFGVSHDVLGAALCETWGLVPAAVYSVRHHVEVQATLELPKQPAFRAVCALSVLVNCLMRDPEGAPCTIAQFAEPLELSPAEIENAVRLLRAWLPTSA